MSDLPKFSRRSRKQVEEYIRRIFTNEHQTSQSRLLELIDYPDGHYRAIFDPAFFILPEGEAQPSKSQWNNLKKKMKRHDDRVFIFKEHGDMGNGRYYVDFGFFTR
jgi:hypothetical protein